jgi:hypothetical protein
VRPGAFSASGPGNAVVRSGRCSAAQCLLRRRSLQQCSDEGVHIEPEHHGFGAAHANQHAIAKHVVDVVVMGQDCFGFEPFRGVQGEDGATGGEEADEHAVADAGEASDAAAFRKHPHGNRSVLAGVRRPLFRDVLRRRRRQEGRCVGSAAGSVSDVPPDESHGAREANEATRV